MKKLFIVFSITLISLSFLNPLKLKADSEACETEIVTNSYTGDKYCMPESIYNGQDQYKVKYRTMVRSGQLNSDDLDWLEEYATANNNQRMAILNKDLGGIWDTTKAQASKYFEGLKSGAIGRMNVSTLKYLLGGFIGGYNTDMFQAEINSMQESNNKNYYTSGQTINNNQVYNEGSTFYTSVYNDTTNNFYDITNNNYYEVNNWNYDITNNYYTYNIDNSRHYRVENTYNCTNVYNFNNGNENAYSMYFRLPDGSNSYNLTEENIKGLRTDFIIKNYDNIYDYDSLLGLYHFDGNLKNSAYGGSEVLEFSKGSNTYNDSALNFGQALFYSGDFGFGVNDGEVLDFKLMPMVSNKFALEIKDKTDTNLQSKYDYFSFSYTNSPTIKGFVFNNENNLKIEITPQDYSSGTYYLLQYADNQSYKHIEMNVSSSGTKLQFYNGSSTNSFTTSYFSNNTKITLEFNGNSVYYNCGDSILNTSGSYTFSYDIQQIRLFRHQLFGPTGNKYYQSNSIKFKDLIVSNNDGELFKPIALYDSNNNTTYIKDLVSGDTYDYEVNGYGELVGYSSGLSFFINKKYENQIEFFENGYINNSISYLDTDNNSYYINFGSWNHILLKENSNNTELFINGKLFTTLNSSIKDLYFDIKQDGWSMIDEVRVLNSSDNFNYYGMPNLPYDTNLIFILPKELDYNNNILIKSVIPVNDWQIGGVRRSNPSKGDVFIYVDDFGYMKSLQQYDGTDWIAVDGALYNKVLGKWVDYNGFSIYLNDFTYQESQDITIYSITDDFSFYQWLQQEINRIIKAIESISFNNVVNNNSFFPESTNLWDFLIKLMEDLINGVGEIVDKLIDFIKWLLIPDENFNIDSELELIQTNLGILCLPFNLLGNIFNYLFNNETLTQNHVINFNGFDFMNVRLIPSFTYDFDSLFNIEPFNTMHNIYLSVIDFVCIVYVINLARKKFISFTGGNE